VTIAVIYVLCALTASLCAFLLLRAYYRAHARLLLFGALCFVGLALNNIVLVIDRVLLRDADLTIVRMVPAVLGVAALLYGLVTEGD
jgi:hypothetical protein